MRPYSEIDPKRTLNSRLPALYVMWGKLDEAEKMYRLALGIEEELDGQQGMAKVRLGIIYAKRGDLIKAAQMHYGALEIERRLSRKEA